jgi:hypothetical protein
MITEKPIYFYFAKEYSFNLKNGKLEKYICVKGEA